MTNGKACTKCGIWKEYTQYYSRKDRPSGYQSSCKECVLKKDREYRANIIPTEVSEKFCNKCGEAKEAKFFKNNVASKDGLFCWCRDCDNEYKKEYRVRNPEKMKQVDHDKYYKNRDHILEQKKEYYKENKETIMQYLNDYRRHRLETDVEFLLLHRLRSRIKNALQGNFKSGRSVQLIGCSSPFLKDWLKFQFYDEMSWKNYGNHWHIDHVRCCSSFNLSHINEQYVCFNWSNLAPLRADKNMSKGTKRNIYTEVLQELKARMFLKRAGFDDWRYRKFTGWFYDWCD